ncbi:MAG: hypothetical protein ACAH95_11265 [Fimbriimonas sp.]
MTIRFAKPRHAERPPTCTVIRDDGSTTGQATSDFFVAHDLTHYAVETELGLRQAFFGLLNSGLTFESFTDRQAGSAKARTLPEDAYLAECIVGALDAQRYDPSISDEDVMLQLGPFAEKVGIAQLQNIRRVRDEHLRAYAALPAGATLELAF